MPAGRVPVQFTKELLEMYDEGYERGFRDGQRSEGKIVRDIMGGAGLTSRVVKPKRKLSAWQKFVKANSKKPRFKYKSGAKKGRVNLKALGVASRKKKRR